MTNEEAVYLMTYAAQACPQQRFDEFTGDVWYDLLGDLSLQDAKQGLIAAAKKKPFVSPAEIRAEVKLIRDARINQAQITMARTADPDDVGGANAELRALIQQVADGARMPTVAALEPSGTPRPADSEPYQQLRADLEGQTPEFRRLRAASLVVACRHCQAPVGSACTVGVDGPPLTRSAAHSERLQDAGVADPAPTRDPAEFAALLGAEGREEASGG